MLGAMKSVKMLGLARFISQTIREQRTHELNEAGGYRWIVLMTQSIGMPDLLSGSSLLGWFATYIPHRLHTVHHVTSAHLCGICGASQDTRIESSGREPGADITGHHHSVDAASLHTPDSHSRDGRLYRMLRTDSEISSLFNQGR